RTGAPCDRGSDLLEIRPGDDDLRQPVLELEQRCRGRRLLHLRAVGHRSPRCPRRPGRATTPSGTGSNPTAVQSSSPQASTCGPMSPVGVHEARISSWALPPSSAIPPKLSEVTLVTVPDGASKTAPWDSS